VSNADVSSTRISEHYFKRLDQSKSREQKTTSFLMPSSDHDVEFYFIGTQRIVRKK
jgi:hypothetical protein